MNKPLRILHTLNNRSKYVIITKFKTLFYNFHWHMLGVTIQGKQTFLMYQFITVNNTTYRVSQEECEILRESVPYVKLYRYNPKHLYPKLNGYGDNGQKSLKLWQLLHTYWLPNTYWNWQEYVVSVMLISVLNIKVTCEW